MPLTEQDLAFARRAYALKRTVRAGWTRVAGVRDPESVAEHEWGLALLAMLAAARDPTLDAARLLRVALAHDLAEAVVGDLVPGEYASAAEKHARERRGLNELLRTLDPIARAAIEEAWNDYEDGRSREARLVADLDKVEMALQASVYAEEGGDARALAEFHASAVAKCEDSVLSVLLRNLVRGAP